MSKSDPSEPLQTTWPLLLIWGKVKVWAWAWGASQMPTNSNAKIAATLFASFSLLSGSGQQRPSPGSDLPGDFPPEVVVTNPQKTKAAG